MAGPDEDGHPDNVHQLHKPPGDFDLDIARLARVLALNYANELYPPTQLAEVIAFPNLPKPSTQ